MRNVAIATVLLFLGTATVITLSGCRQESGNRSLRRARLVGNENIELKKQLKQRDKEIKRQKQLVVQCRAERDKEIKRQKQLVVQYRAKRTNGKELNGDNTLVMLKYLAESARQFTVLTAENTQLTEKIKELEAR